MRHIDVDDIGVLDERILRVDDVGALSCQHRVTLKALLIGHKVGQRHLYGEQRGDRSDRRVSNCFGLEMLRSVTSICKEIKKYRVDKTKHFGTATSGGKKKKNNKP